MFTIICSDHNCVYQVGTCYDQDRFNYVYVLFRS